ncbi:hypothetical protein HH308_14700 [Gordonia sp. TBRC 11910]|uniref:Dynamin family protein n=1 Tax=Gordonia asplenii TaxID=2725283 RepID=A0A848KUW1_9ACTN|nr:hypothetical protein [Gordonia asplenii]NMO02466.1 hypothetical protein [Gordonia asplenii]
MPELDAGEALLTRAAEVLGRPVGRVRATGRIVVDDGADGTLAAQLISACRSGDAALDMVAGGPVTDASIVVIVVDAGCANGAGIRPMVERYLRVVGRVALVCTKIDVFWEWPATLAADRAVADPLRLCPLFAVATDVPDDPHSGVDALVEWLRAESSGGGSAAVRAQLAMTAAALADDAAAPEQAMELRRRRAALVAERDRGRADRLAGVRAGLSGCRAAGATRLAARLREASARASAGIDAVATHSDAQRVSTWLHGALRECAQSESAELHARLARIRAVALLGIEAPGVGPLALPPIQLPIRSLPKPNRGADDALVMVLGASSGLGVGRLVALPLADAGFAGWGSTAATVIVGLAMALWVVRTRRRAATRTTVRAWVTEATAQARARIEQSMAITVTDVEAQIAVTVARHYERSDRRIVRAVADVDAQLRLLSRRERDAGRADAVCADIARYLAEH